MYCWYDPAPRPGWAQMALDQALLDAAEAKGIACFRLYRWEEDTLSLGANESAGRHWNREALAAAAVPVVRRPTGGRAVWHTADDLTYATAFPSEGIPAARAAYRLIHERFVTALGRLGISGGVAPASPRSPGLAGGNCFDSAAGGEVLVAGRKAIGSAQLLRRTALLQHGEIARAERQGALARFTRGGSGIIPPAVPADLPAADQLAEALLREWTAAGATVAPPAVRAALETAGRTHETHYRNPGWTWRR